MDGLERYARGGLSAWTSGGRSTAKDLASVQRELWVALAKDAGVADYTEHAMHNTVRLDRKRQLLAGDNEFLNGLLAEQEVSYVLESEAIKRDMFKPWT